MIYVPNECHDPQLNLASEEYLLCGSGIREDILFFYINAPSVIIGRHQNTVDEIDAEYIREHRISVVRRLSGGGAVYHDLGNLNFSFIHPDPNAAATADFGLFTAPIVDALNQLGAPVHCGGRNDLLLPDGTKVSGCAYYHNAHGAVCHGTLLFDSDLDALAGALRPRPEKIASKGVDSVRSRVTNLKSLLPSVNSAEELRTAIIDILRRNHSIRTVSLTDEQKAACDALAEERYRRDVWNYGASPAYTLRKLLPCSAGTIDFRADIRDGVIRSARFFGDFFCAGDICSLEEALTGLRFERKSLSGPVEALWKELFPAVPFEDFTEILQK